MKNTCSKAADRDDTEAQFNLGIMYENGLDDSRYAVEGGRPEAMRWLLAAAEQGLLASRADRTRRDLRRRARRYRRTRLRLAGGTCWRRRACVAPISRRLSPVRLPARLLPLDAASNRRGRAFGTGLEVKGADHRGNVGSAGNARGRTSVIRGRSANCHSDPDRPGLGGIHHASSVPLSSPRESGGLAGRDNRRGDGHRRWCRRSSARPRHYRGAWSDHRGARAEGSDNLDKAGAESLAAKTAMQERFADYQSRYKARYP